MGQIQRLIILGKRTLAYVAEQIVTWQVVATIATIMVSIITDFSGFIMPKFWPLAVVTFTIIPCNLLIMVKTYITNGVVSPEELYIILGILIGKILVFTVLEAFIFKGETGKKFLGLETVRKKGGEKLGITELFMRNLVKHTVAGICPVFLITNIHDFTSGAVTREKERAGYP